jgi:hypothetical protein
VTADNGGFMPETAVSAGIEAPAALGGERQPVTGDEDRSWNDLI